MSSPNSPGTDPLDFAASAESLRRQGDAEGARSLAAQGLENEPESERGLIALTLALLDLGDIGNARTTLVGLLDRMTLGDKDTELAASDAPAPLAPGGPLDVPDQEAERDVLQEAQEGAVADDELDAAFASAETRTDEMMSANHVVEQTLETHSAVDDEFDLTDNPTYATQSMVELLQGQGRGSEADTLRARLAESSNEPSPESEEQADLHAVEPMGIEGGPLVMSEEPMPEGQMREELMPEELRLAIGADSFGPDDAERLRIVATLESWLHNVRRNSTVTNRNA